MTRKLARAPRKQLFATAPEKKFQKQHDASATVVGENNDPFQSNIREVMFSAASRPATPIESTFPSTSMSVPSSSQTSVSAPKDSGSDVFAFLDACMPSMARHLPIFLEFGCKSQQDLLGISTWLPGSIEDFLGRLPPNNNGEQLSEMEKAHLKNHFFQYFEGP